MKKLFIFVFIFVHLFFIDSLFAKPIVIERIVAKINEEIITLSELQEFVRMAKLELKRKYRGKDLEKKLQDLEQKALDKLVERKLLIQIANELVYKLGKAKAVKVLQQQYPDYAFIRKNSASFRDI